MFKLKNISTALGLLLVISSASHTALASTANTNITFVGSINDTPCTLDPSSMDQEIKLGEVSAQKLANNGKGEAEPFSIKLTGCKFDANKNSVDITFSGGPSNGTDYLGTTHEDVGVELLETSGDRIVIGTPVTHQNLGADPEIKFLARVIGLKVDAPTDLRSFSAGGTISLVYP